MITNTHISVLPTLLTIGNFVCGLMCILLCIQSIYWYGSSVIEGPVKQTILFHNACIMVFIGMIFDMFDGYAARATNSQSNLGGELDSLADMCTFGVAPSVILATLWIRAMPVTAEWWSFSLIAGIVFSSSAMLRLAIYNTSISAAAKTHFSGLPSPAAAGVVVSSALFFSQDYISDLWSKYYNAHFDHLVGNLGYPGRNTSQIVAVYLFSLFTIIVGLLMVSHFKFAHVANLWLGRAKKLHVFLLMLGILLLLSIDKWRNLSLFLGFNGYIIICLFINFRNILTHKNEHTDSDISKFLNFGDDPQDNPEK